MYIQEQVEAQSNLSFKTKFLSQKSLKMFYSCLEYRNFLGGAPSPREGEDPHLMLFPPFAPTSLMNAYGVHACLWRVYNLLFLGYHLIQRDIVATTLLRCMCVHVYVCPSIFVQARTYIYLWLDYKIIWGNGSEEKVLFAGFIHEIQRSHGLGKLSMEYHQL